MQDDRHEFSMDLNPYCFGLLSGCPIWYRGLAPSRSCQADLWMQNVLWLDYNSNPAMIVVMSDGSTAVTSGGGLGSADRMPDAVWIH